MAGSQTYGFNSYLGFGLETTYGTPVASSKWLELQKDAVKFKQTKISKPTLRNVTINHRVKSKKVVDGDVEIQVPFNGAELLLKHAMGANNTSGPTDSAYTHSMTLAQVLPVGLTLNINRDQANLAANGGVANSIFTYAGCQIAKLTLKQAMEDFLMATFSFVGQDVSNTAVETPTFPTFIGADYEMFALTIAGGAFACESFELTVDNGLATDRYKLGTSQRKGLGRGTNRKVSGKIVGEFQSLADWQNYKNLGTAALVATWTGGLIGATSTYTITATLPTVQFDGEDPGVDNSGPLKLTLPFTAYQNAADNDELTLSLKNTVTSIA
jgi:Phage tail tube protein